MNYQLYFNERSNCKTCKEPQKGGFKYVTLSKKEKFEFENENKYILIFLLSGKSVISCNEFHNIVFESQQICLLPISAQCVWEVIEDTQAIILSGNDIFLDCDKISVQYSINHWLNIESDPQFPLLEIHPRIAIFLESIKDYLLDGITCPNIHHIKQGELSLLIRAYYPAKEVMTFFMPIIKNAHEFKQFIMKNYLQMKGVKEFVDLSGLNLNTFNRKFKIHFGESPYQWMIKQKSKHILYELCVRDKSIADVMREFHFSDASHFNRYCKAMFGAPPTILRNKIKNKSPQ